MSVKGNALLSISINPLGRFQVHYGQPYRANHPFIVREHEELASDLIRLDLHLLAVHKDDDLRVRGWCKTESYSQYNLKGSFHRIPRDVNGRPLCSVAGGV